MKRYPSLLIGCLTAAALGTALAAGTPAGSTSMGASTAATSPNPDQEIATALQHAGMSAGSTTLADVHMHLHHVINCLVGPAGKDYDSTAEDPCKGQGNGAINDVDNKGMRHMKLVAALKQANKGLKENGLKQAQRYAKDVMKDLQAAQKGK